MEIEAKLLAEIRAGGVSMTTAYRYLVSFGLARMVKHTVLPDNNEELLLCGVYKYIYNPETKVLRSFRRVLTIEGDELKFDWVKTRAMMPVRMLYLPGASGSEEFKVWVKKSTGWFIQDLINLGVKGISYKRWDWERVWGCDDPEYHYGNYSYVRSDYTALFNQDWIDNSKAMKGHDFGESIRSRLIAYFDTDQIRLAHNLSVSRTRHWLDRRYLSLYLRSVFSNESDVIKSRIYFSTILHFKSKKPALESWNAHEGHLPYMSLISNNEYKREDLFENKVFLECLRAHEAGLTKGELRVLLKQSKSISSYVVDKVLKAKQPQSNLGYSKKAVTMKTYAAIFRIDGFGKLPISMQRLFLEKFAHRFNPVIFERWLQYYSDAFKQHGAKKAQGFYNGIFNEMAHVLDWTERCHPAPQIHKSQDWKALHDASNAWVKRLIEEKKQNRESISWTPILKYSQWKKIEARELTSAYELDIEGEEMLHCVGSYADDCAAGHYRVFSLQSKTERTTLGVRLETGGQYSLCQLQAYENSYDVQPSAAMYKAANSLIEELNEIMLHRKAA